MFRLLSCHDPMLRLGSAAITLGLCPSLSLGVCGAVGMEWVMRRYDRIA